MRARRMPGARGGAAAAARRAAAALLLLALCAAPRAAALPVLCPAGQFYNTTSARCEGCPAGTWSGGANSTYPLMGCTQCPDWTTTNGTANATSPAFCSGGLRFSAQGSGSKQGSGVQRFRIQRGAGCRV